VQSACNPLIEDYTEIFYMTDKEDSVHSMQDEPNRAQVYEKSMWPEAHLH
jgi:hypothetical protein